MKDNEQIHENLKNLPKYSLNNEQKKRVIMKLHTEQKPAKNKVFYKPFIVAIASLTLFSFLVFYEFNGNQSTPSKHNQIVLNAEEGKKFILSDTKQEAIGIENNVALLNTFDQFVAKDKRRGAKLMIFYWGDPSELVGKNYRVLAKNSIGEEITLSEGELYPTLNSEDAHTLTSFEPFPTKGTWQLSFYVGEHIHGAFTLDVLPPLPNTEHYTLLNSPEEFEIGRKVEISIESSLENKKEIDVKLVNDEGIIIDQSIFTQVTMYFDASTNDPIYHYSGKLKFPEQGNWALIIDGEKTQLFNN